MDEIIIPTTYPATVTFTNLLSAANAGNDEVWNTGMSAAGFPYCDEDAANAGLAIIDNPDNLLPLIKRGLTAVAIYGLRNEYWILGTEETNKTLTIPVPNPEAAVFYANQASESLKVEITNGEETGTATVDNAESL